jgi:thioredoxin reductase (NADPH)
MIDIVVIGAGCAGMTAAIYAARAGKKVLVLESEGIGGQIASSPKVENYPGISSISGIEFSDNLFAQAQSLDVDFDFSEVKGIKPQTPLKVVTDGGEIECMSIVIAVGSKRRTLGIENETALTGHGVSYCAVCDGAFYRDKDVAVVGGGNAALQSAEYLCGICKSVVLIHRRDTFRAENSLAESVKNQPNIKIEFNSTVETINGEKSLSGIKIRSSKTGEEKELSVAGLFVAAGQIPQNSEFSDCVRLDDEGYVLASEDCATNVPGVFAAGDCRKKAVRQLTTAAADGTVAALAACSFIEAHYKN